MQNIKDCPICGAQTPFYPDHGRMVVFYECPVCGRFELSPLEQINKNHLASYLVYNAFLSSDVIEYRYHTGLEKEICDQYRKEFDEGNREHGRPVHMDAEIIANWYPKTFSERVDNILLYLGAHIPHIGQEITLGWHKLLSILFVDRYDVTTASHNPNYLNQTQRDDGDCDHEVQYMLNYLQSEGYIEWVPGGAGDDGEAISLTPKGYARIETLQKNTAYGRNVLVAMKFGDDTIPLREAIRKGITDAGYVAIFIDEVQHNDFITPELLKHIRESKFVVVDLTHQNNGAYFEEGYAMGLGKQIIQLCQKDQRLHFDIAQKNTIMWGTEEDIPERLKNRIKATID